MQLVSPFQKSYWTMLYDLFQNVLEAFPIASDLFSGLHTNAHLDSKRFEQLARLVIIIIFPFIAPLMICTFWRRILNCISEHKWRISLNTKQKMLFNDPCNSIKIEKVYTLQRYKNRVCKNKALSQKKSSANTFN